jgi:hypothetical protein
MTSMMKRVTVSSRGSAERVTAATSSKPWSITRAMGGS